MQRGFTLIELLLSLVMVAILVAVAYPAYTAHIVKANRAAAQAQMLDIASRQQQFLVVNRAYASKADLETSGYTLPSNLGTAYSYDIAVGTDSVPAFTVTFSGLGRQAADGNLTLNSEGRKEPSGKW